jgi:hypothetical protein
MDYLLSAVQHLTEGEGPPGHRALKYAVLHLHSATEVLLKARLVREHWSLVFSDPGKATWGNYEAGRFSSATLDWTIKRLRDIANVDVGERTRTAISALSETRNAFTHYGHSASAYAVESQATEVLEFLVDFIDEHLYDPASASRFGQEYEETMRAVQERLGRIDSLVRGRMRTVEAELKDQQDQTIQCPACRRYAVAVESTPRCRFCTAKWDDASSLASEYVFGVVGVDNGQLNICGACEMDWPSPQTLVLGASVAADPHTDIGLCFRCGVTYVQRITPQPHYESDAT